MSFNDLGAGWRFGPFELHLEHGCVTDGSRIIPVSDIEREILAILVEHGGEPVPHETIIARVWRGRAIDGHNLTAAIHDLRLKLGDSTIKTVYRVGYRLGCEAEPLYTAAEQYCRYLISYLLEGDRARDSMTDGEWDAKYLPLSDDITISLDWALERVGRKHIAIALAGVSGRIWERSGNAGIGRMYVERCVTLADPSTKQVDTARLMYCGGLLIRDTDRRQALEYFGRSVVIYRQRCDIWNLGSSLAMLGETQLYLGDYALAKANLEEARKILIATDRFKHLWTALNNLGILSNMSGDKKEALYYFDLARDLGRNMKDDLREFLILMNIAELDFSGGAIDRAIDRAQEARRGLRFAPVSFRSRPVINLAIYEATRTSTARARAYAEEALKMMNTDEGYWLRLLLLVWSFVAAKEGQHSVSARLYGFVSEQFARFGETWQLPEATLRDSIIKLLSENLPADSLEIWRQEGSRWSAARAVEYVKDYLVSAL
jgi:tetratricopeptide (TPR) repeat protein